MSLIKVRIMGGLGNQLFSYAAARRLALINNCELIIDDVSGFCYDSAYRRNYQLDRFSIPCRKARPGERLEPFSRARRFLCKQINRRKDFFSRNYIVQEAVDFDERLLKFVPKEDIYIEGYWQSENYFIDIIDSLREELVIKPPTDQKNLSIMQDIGNRNAVAMHFRYFTPKDNSPDNLSLLYYERAYERILKSVKDPHFFIFSDNPSLAVKTLPIPAEHFTMISHNQQDSMAFADLWLMQQCRHFIIANSTFSWWGAWLSMNRDKIIVAPEFNKRTGVSWWGFDGLLPESWIKIKSF